MPQAENRLHRCGPPAMRQSCIRLHSRACGRDYSCRPELVPLLAVLLLVLGTLCGGVWGRSGVKPLRSSKLRPDQVSALSPVADPGLHVGADFQADLVVVQSAAAGYIRSEFHGLNILSVERARAKKPPINLRADERIPSGMRPDLSVQTNLRSFALAEVLLVLGRCVDEYGVGGAVPAPTWIRPRNGVDRRCCRRERLAARESSVLKRSDACRPDVFGPFGLPLSAPGPGSDRCANLAGRSPSRVRSRPRNHATADRSAF